MPAKAIIYKGVFFHFIKTQKGTAFHRPHYYTIFELSGNISIASISEAGSGLLK